MARRLPASSLLALPLLLLTAAIPRLSACVCGGTAAAAAMARANSALASIEVDAIRLGERQVHVETLKLSAREGSSDPHHVVVFPGTTTTITSSSYPPTYLLPPQVTRACSRSTAASRRASMPALANASPSMPVQTPFNIYCIGRKRIVQLATPALERLTTTRAPYLMYVPLYTLPIRVAVAYKRRS